MKRSLTARNGKGNNRDLTSKSYNFVGRVEQGALVNKDGEKSLEYPFGRSAKVPVALAYPFSWSVSIGDGNFCLPAHSRTDG